MADEPDKPADALPQDRRMDERHIVLKTAQIYYNDRKSTISCRVRNISETGARLEFPTAQLLPHSFELHIPGLPMKLCMLRWAKGNIAGVWFVS